MSDTLLTILKHEIRANLAQIANSSTPTSRFRISGGLTPESCRYSQTRGFCNGTVLARPHVRRLRGNDRFADYLTGMVGTGDHVPFPRVGTGGWLGSIFIRAEAESILRSGAELRLERQASAKEEIGENCGT